MQSTNLPVVIQGGMGAAVSNWRLANAVSKLGQLGVVSGTALDLVLARRLEQGDPGGHCRRALEAFPYSDVADRVLNAYYRFGGKASDEPYRPVPLHTLEGTRKTHELTITANFVEVFLAREGHDNPVGINYLEKIQLPHLPSLYGAMLAGVDYVIMGAGIPFDIPGAMDAFVTHSAASYPLRVTGARSGEDYRVHFDPRAWFEGAMPDLKRPRFLPIIAADALAIMLCRKANGRVDGFVIEGPTAGGHNAPPRGALKLTEDGQPIYGERDVVSLDVIKGLGLPFWLAGSYGAPDKLQEALALGAAGIQVGTAFALCTESGLEPTIRRTLVEKALRGEGRIFTDPVGSPTGFPFKVAQLDGTLSDPCVYAARERICDLGYLREAYRKDNGHVGFRCPGEPLEKYLAKGGKPENVEGRKCLCNGLSANVGLSQLRKGGYVELPYVTLGDDYLNIARFCTDGQPDFTAADVLNVILAHA